MYLTPSLNLGAGLCGLQRALDAGQSLPSKSKDLSIRKNGRAGPGGKITKTCSLRVGCSQWRPLLVADSIVGNGFILVIPLLFASAPLPCSAGKRDSGNNGKEPDYIIAAH